MFKYAGILLAAAALLAPMAARAETDVETCDHLAAYPDDPDKPAGVAGNYHIPRPDVGAAVKACKAATSADGVPRRIWFELGRAYEFNHQAAEALQAYRKAIDMGSTSAMVGIGGMYAHGSGVKANPAEARKWIERAAAAGDPTGMANLGAIYGSGMGVPVDFAKSRAWYTKAAAANSSEAMFQLGMMTQDGDGGPKDDAAAQGVVRKGRGAQPRGRAGAARRLCRDRPRRTEGSSGGHRLLQESGSVGRRGCARGVEAHTLSVHAQRQEWQSRG